MVHACRYLPRYISMYLLCMCLASSDLLLMIPIYLDNIQTTCEQASIPREFNMDPLLNPKYQYHTLHTLSLT